MGDEGRLIRQFALVAPRREAVGRLMPEIEDAFRTASLPAAGGAVIQVRRLDLGVIDARARRQAIALRIAEAARQAAPVAVTAAAPVPEGAAALHWPDRVEWLAAALLAVDRGGPLPWWAVRVLGPASAVAGPGAVPAAARALAAAAGPEAMAALVLRLAALGARPGLVVALAPAIEAAAAALGAGETPVFRVAPPVAEIGAQPGAGGALSPSAVAEVPPEARAAALWRLLPARVRGMLAPLAPPAGLDARGWAALAVIVAARLHGRAALPALRRAAAVLPGRFPSDPRPLSGPDPAAAKLRRDAAPGAARDAAVARALPIGSSLGDEPVVAHPEATGVDLASADAPTRCGGLPMLVNLVRMAGLESFDERLDAGLCVAVLRRLAGRQAGGDPILGLLPEGPDFAPVALMPCHPAPGLLALARPVLVAVRLVGRPGLRVLALRGRYPVAVVDRERLAAVAAAVGRGRIGRCGAAPFDAAVAGAALAGGLALLLRRALRLITGRPWCDGLHRRGRVALTATHCDVTLDLDDIRLPERRAGLDRDPGWVPWLGRVVLLHFERLGPVPREAVP